MADTATSAIVQEALDRSEILVLATVDPEAGSWTCPLQYQWDQNLSLYFSSLPDARHVSNINRDQRVAVAIYSFPGPPGGNLGLQMTGVAEHAADGTTPDGWLRFKITPTRLWYFDSRIDRGRHEVDLSALQLGSLRSNRRF